MLESKIISIFFVLALQSPTFSTLENVYDDMIRSPITYEELLDEATYNCRARSAKDVPRELLDILVATEIKHGVPHQLRGILLAAACHESGYDPMAEGDHKFDKKGKPKAIGLFQMWPWWTRNPPFGYGIERTNPEQTAEAFILHIKKQISKVKKRCRYRSKLKIWVAAWVHAIRAPKPSGRCFETPKHYRVLKRWRKEIMNKRKKVIEAGDGC